MGAVFSPQKPVNIANIPQALKQIESMIQIMREELEYKLAHLDSTNVSEISTSQTKIISGTGESVLSGSEINLTGNGKAAFRAGFDTTANIFRFEVKDKDGTNVLYLNSSGELVISKNATLSIDGGEW